MFVLLAVATLVLSSASNAEVSAQIKSSVRPYLLLTLNDTLSPLTLQTVHRCPKTLWQVHFNDSFQVGEALLQFAIPYEEKVGQ